MNKTLLVAIPLSLVLVAAAIGGIVIYEKTHAHKKNTTTIYEWYQCSTGLSHSQCDQIADETQKSACYQAATLVSDLTYVDSADVLEACAKFNTYLLNAQTEDELNANNYYQNCYTNSQVLKDASVSKFYNDKIYTPFYVKCAGF